MAVNKVVFNTANGEQTLIDLTKDNVTAEAVFEGATFHGPDGEVKTGTFTIAEEMSEQDSLIAQIQTALQGKAAGGGSGLPSQEKTVEITENGNHEILPDDGYVLSKVTAVVDVPIPDGYIQPSGTLEVTENGTHDVTAYASVNVNVEAGGGDELVKLLSNELTSLNSDVTTLRECAFRDATNLVSVSLPKVKTIQKSAFTGCTGLVNVNLPELTTLETQVFNGCINLETVILPKVATPGTNAFVDCSGLKRIDLPACTRIGTNLFLRCGNLQAVILRSTKVVILSSTSAFKDSGIANGTGYVYVSKNLLSEYVSASNWSTFASQFRAIEDYPEICGGAE